MSITSVLPLWLVRRGASESVADTAWRSLREALLATPYYSGGARRKVVERAVTPGGLARIPPLPLEEYYRHCLFFQNRRAAASPPVTLAAPWTPLPNAVAVLPWFRLAPPVRTLMHAAPEDVGRCKPAVLAGSVVALRTIADAVLDGALTLDSLEFGILAFTGLGRPPLTAADRKLFWEAFGVPVFEQFRGFQGELLAYECEGHEALHWNKDTVHWERHTDGTLLLTSLANLRYPTLRLATGIPIEVAEGVCSCGQTATRALLSIPPIAAPVPGRHRATRTARQA